MLRDIGYGLLAFAATVVAGVLLFVVAAVVIG